MKSLGIFDRLFVSSCCIATLLSNFCQYSPWQPGLPAIHLSGGDMLTSRQTRLPGAVPSARARGRECFYALSVASNDGPHPLLCITGEPHPLFKKSPFPSLIGLASCIRLTSKGMTIWSPYPCLLSVFKCRAPIRSSLCSFISLSKIMET